MIIVVSTEVINVETKTATITNPRRFFLSVFNPISPPTIFGCSINLKQQSKKFLLNSIVIEIQAKNYYSVFNKLGKYS